MNNALCKVSLFFILLLIGCEPTCQTDGGFANDSGLKTWCWNDMTIPSYSGSNGVTFSNEQLVVDSDCAITGVTIANGRINFRVSPSDPPVESWCSSDFNVRAEVRTAPWKVKNPLGTEEWFGWNYRFGESYQVDPAIPWIFFQIHNGEAGDSSTLILLVTTEDLYSKNAGEIQVINYANNPEMTDWNPTGVIPQARESIDIVVHIIWGDSGDGLLQVWINGKNVYDKQVATVYDHALWGGNAKWGIHKWKWREENDVQASLRAGVDKVETSMGPIRMITRFPGDPNYGNNSFSEVAPR